MRATFLDRDDTLVVDLGYMNDPAKVRLAHGVLPALRRIQGAGFALVVVSNQSGVARGLITPDQVMAIQERICRLLPDLSIAAFEYCFHHPDQGCPCRKPRPEMILRAAARLGVDLARSVMVGDRETDVMAGQAAGCWTVRLLRDPDQATATRADHVAPDLEAAAEWIVNMTRPKPPIQRT